MFFCGRSRPQPEVGTEPPVQYEVQSKPIENADFIPLRLTMMERKSQRLMRGVMLASSYTDKVDVPTHKLRQAAINREIINALSGFVTGLSIPAGGVLLKEKDFTPHEKNITHAVEAMRRYKIMNPDLLRTDYIKFLYMIQDAMLEESVMEMLEFPIAKPVVTIGSYLKRIGAEAILKDERLALCITPVPNISDRAKLNRALRFKDVSVDRLVKEYAKKSGSSTELVEIAVRSLNDANNFSDDNVKSIETMIGLLIDNFPSKDPSDRRLDLSIAEGQQGSRLTHAHELQYAFVHQSLSLWKNISKQMFRLWLIAEQDMLDPANPYEFRSTGQGYQRVQQAPTLYNALSEILEDTKKEIGKWVGSDKIHLGDNQVPNAFHFIDKYGQISRIIIPILRTIANVEKEAREDKEKRKYVEEVWGSVKHVRADILADFFRHGFDGSGGDNMDDAGSCIDGRLTSAWNWCNSIRSKPYYPLFLMAGFSSFDGDLTL